MTESVGPRVWVSAESTILSTWFKAVLPPSVATCSVHGADPAPLLLLESPGFAKLDAADELKTYVVEILERMTALASVHHLGLLERPFTMHRIDGSRWNMRRTLRFKVMPQIAPKSLTAASRAFQCADTDDRVAHALRLLRDPVVGWHTVYDTVDFLLANWPPAREDRDLVNRHQRTANYYRHLGKPQDWRLPKSPPSLMASRRYVLQRVQRWLEEATSSPAGPV